MLVIRFAIWRQHFPKLKGIVCANYLSTFISIYIVFLHEPFILRFC